MALGAIAAPNPLKLFTDIRTCPPHCVLKVHDIFLDLYSSQQIASAQRTPIPSSG